jgi:hypothetical protein
MVLMDKMIRNYVLLVIKLVENVHQEIFLHVQVAMMDICFQRLNAYLDALPENI